ncbi:MAG: 2-iminoacetate synthase ThiH [Spirochaetes bacterium]|nr:2-iminoacetate synthase ThiH [Spirochaetota bacterium]
MSTFLDVYYSLNYSEIEKLIFGASKRDVLYALRKASNGEVIENYFALFSPAADEYLEQMAQLSHAITRRRFGNIIQLYAPLYLSNECANCCAYCGFNRNNNIERITLTVEQIEREAHLLYRQGFRHILLVSGEHRGKLPLETLAEIASRIHRNFSSVSIEVYPMDEDEYAKMISSGVDGLTIYQETYNKNVYETVHPAGPKRDFDWRLAAPDRGGRAGFRKIGIGALLGLSNWRLDGYYTALHARYLTKTYWRSHIQISFPRLRPAEGNFHTPSPVTDRQLVHLICAMRLILPDAGLVLSTREPASLRDHIMPLGITTMSAGSRTEPGGYSNPEGAGKQFEVEDRRSPAEVAESILKHGFDPVWKDWDRTFIH